MFSSYFLYYPKQPYFCRDDWKGNLKQRFVSDCVAIQKLPPSDYSKRIIYEEIGNLNLWHFHGQEVCTFGRV